jgi:hypothetical protein
MQRIANAEEDVRTAQAKNLDTNLEVLERMKEHCTSQGILFDATSSVCDQGVTPLGAWGMSFVQPRPTRHFVQAVAMTVLRATLQVKPRQTRSHWSWCSKVFRSQTKRFFAEW